MFNKTSVSPKSIINNNANILALGKGILVAYLITVPIFAVFAYFISIMDFPQKYIASGVIITTILSLVVAGWTASRNLGCKGWLNGGIIGFIYMIILFILSSITYENYSIDSQVITMFAIGIITGSIGGILGINLKKEKKFKAKNK